MTTFQPHEIEWTPEKVARLWDFYATNRSVSSMYFGAQAGPAVAKYLDDMISLQSIGSLLDLSCGVGDLLAACRPRVRPDCLLAGVDYSAVSVEQARKRLAGHAVPVELSHITGFPIPMAEARFDLVIMTEVVEHLDNDELTAALAECRRLLSPNGYVVITTPNNEDYDASKVCCPECGCVFHRWQHRRTWTVQTLRHEMETAGFQTVVCTPISWGLVNLPTTVWVKRVWRWCKQRLRSLNPPPHEATGLVYIGRGCP
jgi:ubiquinone/menaquinone biosynthesis C-methylase UbiE